MGNGRKKSSKSKSKPKPKPKPKPNPIPNQEVACSSSKSSTGLVRIQQGVNLAVSVGLYPKAYEILEKAKRDYSDQGNDCLGFIHEMFMVVANAAGDIAEASNHHSKATALYLKAGLYPDCVRYALTFLFSGNSVHNDGLLEQALRLFQQGLKLDPLNSSLTEKLKQVQTEIDMLQTQLNKQNELIHSEQREKDRQLAKIKTTTQNAKEIDNAQTSQQAETTTDVPEPVQDSVALAPPLPTPPPLEFQKTYSITIDELSRRVSVEDHLGTRYMTLISNVGAGAHPIQDPLQTFGDLSLLCASSDYFLTIFHPIKHPRDDFDALVVEDVMTFDEFCDQLIHEFRELGHTSKTAWWPFLADKFTLLFSGVIQGLLFLYMKKKRACGNLAGNVYITRQGKAKILPGLGVGHRKDNDMYALIVLMKKLLLCPFESSNIVDVEFSFPIELLSFFSFDSDNKILPVEYRLSHPFFWMESEKLNFPELLNIILFRSPSRLDALNSFLVTNSLFKSWHEKLVGYPLYEAIWERENPEKVRTEAELKLIDSLGAITVTPYDNHVSVLRYFGAAVHHANSIKYATLRGNKLVTRAEVLSALFTIFPSFNMIMFESVGKSVSELVMNEDILEEIWNLKNG